MQRLGVYGGTFNPVHTGHVHLAETALSQLGLDKLLIIPANIPPHKEFHEDVGPEHRLRMCALAFSKLKKADISDMEIRKKGVSFTADTLEQLKEEYPESELFLIMGGDMFLTVDRWKRFDTIKSLCTLCGCARERGEFERLKAFEKELKFRYGAQTFLIQGEIVDVSSSKLRDLLKRGEDTNGYLIEPVEKYIRENKLYRGER